MSRRDSPPTVYFGPLDAEAAWRDPEAASLPEVKDSQARRIVSTLDELQWLFCEEGDVLLTERELLPGHREYLASLGWRFAHAVVPWEAEGPLLPEAVVSRLREARPSPYAVVPGVESFCARLGLRPELPPVDVVRRVNSKAWSQARASGLGLFGAGCLVRTVEALAEEAGRLLAQGACVVKDPLGVSGKGSLIVRSRAELERLGLYLSRQVEAGRYVELLVQPLYERAVDFSCHFEVREEGLRLHGLQAMDNEGFAFSAVRPAPAGLAEELERRGYGPVIERIAQALAKEGYWGPVCVDSMLLRTGELVPLLEVNARKSMGWMNHRLAARVGPALRSRLGMVSLAFRRKVSFEELLEALRRQGLLYDGTREGLLPLGGQSLLANMALLEEQGPGRGAARGRLYVAALAAEAERWEHLFQALVPCLEALGARVGRRA